MRGYFAIGVEGISKAMNLGSVLRTAHAFEASFVFTVGAVYERERARAADTADTPASVPLYEYADPDHMMLPRDCVVVGIEITPDAVDLPRFTHPRCAAYVLGAERGGLSPAMLARCRHVVKIPTKFSINLALAGALVMYDRLVTLGRFPPRPVQPGGSVETVAPHVHGGPRFRR